VDLARLPFTLGGAIGFQVQNALAAVAAAWASGLNPALMARALRTFESDWKTVPGRFNVTHIGDVEIILDYAHNPAALMALGEAVRALGTRHTFGILTLPGDRRDEDLFASTEATLSFVDEYFLHDATPRGRAHNEISRLMQTRIPADKPSMILESEEEAIQAAWRKAQDGDRIIVIAGDVERAMESIERLACSTDEDGACLTPITRHAVAA